MTRTKMPWPIKTAVFSLLGLGGLVLLALVAGLVVVQTSWFKNKVRERIVAEVARATGGRVEIGSFTYDWHRLTAQVAPLVVHGTEPASGPPLFRADKIQVGLKIISVFKKQVDIASLSVEKPRVFVTVAPDGSTNLPVPKLRSGRDLAQQLLDLKVHHFEIHDGLVDYNFQRTPLQARGEHLQISLTFEPAGPRYSGEISSRQVWISWPKLRVPAAFDLDAKVALEKNVIRVWHAKLAAGGAKLEGYGTLSDLASPRAEFDLNAAAPLQELKKVFRIPLEARGGVGFQGHASLESNPFQYRLTGKLTGHDLVYAYQGLVISGIKLGSPVEMTPYKIDLPGVQLSALGGRFRGAARVLDFKKLTVSGVAQDLPLAEAGRLARRDTGQLSALLSGPVELEGTLSSSGLSGVTARAQLNIAPGQGGVPVRGAVTVNYSQPEGTVELGNSQLDIGSTHLEAFGTLGSNLAVHAVSQNLNDVLPLLPLLGETPPAQWPVELHQGQARFDGAVTGPLQNPTISGKIDAVHLKVHGRELDHVTGTVEVDRTMANFQTVTLEQGKMRVEGQGRAGLRDWAFLETSPVSATLVLRGGDLETLIAETGVSVPATGSLSATLRVGGSLESPLVTGTVELENVAAYGEHIPSARADVTFSATALELANAEARNGPARITLNGAYNHTAKDWKDGSLRLDVTASGLGLSQIQHVQDFRAGLGGELELKAGGTAKVVNGVVALTSLNCQATLRNAVVDGHPYGDLQLTASTRLPVLTVAATANIEGTPIRASGEWRMEGDYSGSARVQIPRLTFAALHTLWPGPHARKDLPFDGFIEGEGTISGSLNQPSAMHADITLSRVQLTANPGVQPPPGAQPQDLVLRNAQPVRLAATTQSIDVRSASFTAKDTTLDASGRLALSSKNPWDVTVKGRINLSILQIFNPGLLATGVSVIDVSVRGPLTEPQVDGRLELRNASLFLRDLPNGVDQANGVILFDRNRATIRNLSAVTGGGEVTFDAGSFVGFRGPALVYRLQASARNVRYRSEDGISVTVNATLGLVGTSENSVLSGTVTVTRVAFGARTDVGALLAATAKPVAASSAPNEYLRGVQLDVRVVTARSLEVESTLTRNTQADVNLRLRGTPDRPVILGNISISSGQIEFFGNKYTINRGVINFYNPAKIEPIIDMDLETKVRGITVDISFSGPLNKLNFSYRSDPPLQANEIIALLAVGRTPSTAGALATVQTSGNTSYMSTGSNLLLSQAIAPASGRLQKFFGVSHIKIDPQLTDITSVPQARLTLEQQVSSVITLTYITNLAVANQQIVRVEWDLNRKWSVVALRDENGAFSIDILYRKRFR
jgi:translocation and assembly module TamB